MKPGDVIRQRYQFQAPLRLVISVFEMTALIYDQEEKKRFLVHIWSHDIVEDVFGSEVK